MTASQKVAAIVLAAGASRRMGRDKALLDLHGEPALARMLRVLRESEVDQIVVVTRDVRSPLRAAVNLEGVTTAINSDTAAGQTRSIRIGLANVSPSAAAFLLCPVDVPLFDARDVRELIAAYFDRPTGSPHRIVVPSDGARRGHPALFAAELRDEFRALADSDPAHLVIRKDRSRVLHIATHNPELFLDLDDDAQYRAALERLRRAVGST
jgi:molybdenum cofactor cytidylyltransferase